MRNKRGQSLLIKRILYVIFIAFILAALIYFASSVAKGEAIRKSVTAKRIALLLDAAQPKTIIVLSDKIFIAKEESKIVVGLESPFSYSFFSPFSINFVAEEKRIEVEKKEK